jgi:hypothetical protein
MKRTLLLICAIAAFSAMPAFAWHCPTGQHWVQVANGTPGATIVEGIPFACFPDTPPPTPTPKPDPTAPSTAAASSSSTSTSNASASVTSNQSQTQGQKQSQGQNQSQTATGGNATATGGNATNAGNNQSTAYSSSYTQVRQAPMAYAPEAFSTALCRAGTSAGVSAPIGAISLGGSKKDKDCERSVLASQFFSRGNYVAGCKLLMHVAVVKEALTFDECVVAVVPKPVVVEAPPVVAPVIPSITVNVPAPVLTPVLTVQAEKPQVITVVAPKPHVAKRKSVAPITCDQAVTKYCAVPPAAVKPTAAKPQATNLCPIIYRDGVKIIMERA